MTTKQSAVNHLQRPNLSLCTTYQIKFLINATLFEFIPIMIKYSPVCSQV